MKSILCLYATNKRILYFFSTISQHCIKFEQRTNNIISWMVSFVSLMSFLCRVDKMGSIIPNVLHKVNMYS